MVPEPYTSSDLLALLDETYPPARRRIAVQEYGQKNPDLIDGLKARGAEVVSVPLYRWELPEDLAPLKDAIEEILSGDPPPVDFCLFTSATQVRHLFRVAQVDGMEERLRRAFGQICVGSVGPIASRAITEQGFSVDFEPDRTKMTHLVREMARRGHDLLLKKRTAVRNGVDTNRWHRIDMRWTSAPSDTVMPAAKDSVFVQACRRQETPYTPIWIMRQAGRYQREYLRIRKDVTMLELCQTPELAAEVTLMAVDRLGVDAAIIFADILLVTQPMGCDLDFVKGKGPVIFNPVRNRSDVQALREAEAEEFTYLLDALQITRKALRPDIGLIGFAGAPFTVASYMVEGGKSSNYVKTKTMMYQDDGCWHALMEKLTNVLIGYLNAQIASGADVVQIFDSWVGSLSPDDYRRYVMPHVKRLIEGLDKSAPVINFSTGNPMLLPLMKEAGGDVIGLDWRCDLAQAWSLLGEDVAVMGNLDPVVLYSSPERIRSAVKTILEKARGRRGHIFNLGHGVLPDMPPENVAELVDAVHELSAK
jgi:uroporphyrinogen decarboxylase